MYVQKFFLRQKIALTINRYSVLAANPDGTEGALMAFAEQKRLALKEKVTFFSDESRTRPVFAFGARNIMDLNGAYDVFDEFGNPIGFFKKDFAASLWNTTFHLEGPGFSATGKERSALVALCRRFVDGFAWPVHFDFVDPSNGQVALSVERQFALRDKYTITVNNPNIDFRVAAAMAVGLDTLIER